MKTERMVKQRTKTNVVDASITRQKALGARLPDKRTGQNIRYRMEDIVLRALLR